MNDFQMMRDQTKALAAAISAAYYDAEEVTAEPLSDERDEIIRQLKHRNNVLKGLIQSLRDDMHCTEPGKAIKLARSIAKRYGFTLKNLQSKRRFTELVHARWHVMWALSEETALSLAGIGRLLNVDHTTVIHGVKQHKQRIASGELFNATGGA